ncbi:uncharacterized protein [Bos mutus]|uniref:uncharacterized protein n=1 Tax=Bos mutus TaxID=72004 RepID=UPI0038B552B7
MAPSCEHGGNGSRQRHSPKGKQIPPNSHSQPRVRGRKGFRTNSGEPAGRPAAGRTLRPAPLPAVTPAPAPRRSSADTAPPPARPQPSGPRLADRGGLHLPACRPHPGPGEAVRGLHGPPPRPRFPSVPAGPGPSPSASCAPGPDWSSNGRGAGACPAAAVVSGPLLCRRNAASWPERLMESSRRCPSPLPPRSTPLSPPPQSETSSLLPAPPSRPPRVRPPRPSPAVPPPPLSGPRLRELPGWGGVARGGEASRAGEAGAPAAAAISAPPSRCPFMEMKDPA